MRRLARHLFTLASALSLLLCGVTCVAWVRSYGPSETYWAEPSWGRSVTFMASRGKGAFRVVRYEPLGRPRDGAPWFGRVSGPGRGSPAYNVHLGLAGVSYERTEFLPLFTPEERQARQEKFEALSSEINAQRFGPEPLSKSSDRWKRVDEAVALLTSRQRWAWEVAAPLWMVAALTSILPTVRIWTWVARARRPRPGMCRRCGYDLRGSPGRCPECGAPKYEPMEPFC